MRVGVVGLGSVGSIVCESMARIGVRDITLIDFDHIESKNLSRTVGSRRSDVQAHLTKVEVAARNFVASSSVESPRIRQLACSLLSKDGIEAALDCDILFSCVDRPFPRHVLNVIAISHLIPVVDGGILAKVDERGRTLHVDWRIHTVSPGERCLVCMGAVSRSDIALDRQGLFDDPDYIANLAPHDRARSTGRNVFAFSLSVAAHMSLHFAKLCGAGDRIGGIGPQTYHAYPGSMTVEETAQCDSDCEYLALSCSAVDTDGLVPDEYRLSNVSPSSQITKGNLKSKVVKLLSRFRRAMRLK